ASTITSMLPDVALAPSAVSVVAAIRPASQPTLRHASRARSGSRSTITGTSSPGVCGTCDRNIEPNLPAPISATRTGLPAVRRALSRRYKFMWVVRLDWACPGHGAAFFTLLRRAGTHAGRRKSVGPGSAAHHFMLRSVRGTNVVLLRGLPLHPRQPQQRVILYRLDRREIAM